MPDFPHDSEHDSALDVRHILIASALVLLAVVCAAIAVAILLRVWRIDPHTGAGAPLDAPVAGAQLETAPQVSLEKYLASKRQRLESYGWVDAQRHVAHIPIETAMQLLAAQASAPSAASDSHQGSKP